jgi:uncharacterized protein (DUF433 family)
VGPENLSQLKTLGFETVHSRRSTLIVVMYAANLMRRVPGIVMVDGPTGRRAVVAGSGLDVWELIATWQACGKDERQLVQNYPWLTQPQLRAALAYYALYPDEIEARAIAPRAGGAGGGAKRNA